MMCSIFYNFVLNSSLANNKIPSQDPTCIVSVHPFSFWAGRSLKMKENSTNDIFKETHSRKHIQGNISKRIISCESPSIDSNQELEC